MLARFFIDRPVFAWVISIVIVLVGLMAMIALPIAQYPNITPPTIQVAAFYPGANAQVVADTVAAPIEQQINGVENMMYMSSQSNNDGSYSLTATFKLGVDLDTAQVLVQNRVAQALPSLPDVVKQTGVTVKKQSPSILLVVNLYSDENPATHKPYYDQLYLSNYATIQVKDVLARVDGVGDILEFGQQDYSMRVWLDPDKLGSRNLTATDVINSLREQNIQVAAGQIGQQPAPTGLDFQYTMNTQGRLSDPAEFDRIVLKTGDDGQVTYLRDVSRSELGARSMDTRCRMDGKPSVGLAAFQLPTANALDTADRLRASMRTLGRRFPQGLRYAIVYDTTPFIRESVDEVFKTLVGAVLLVAVVVLLFLQDWKAVMLPLIDVGVSLVGTFAVMRLMGFTLNNLTLFGLVLAIGIVVDDAIVVLENIERLAGPRPRRPRRDHQSDGRDHRADPGHHAGAVVGVHPQRVPGRHHRPVLPPVRADDFGVDDDLGRQRHDADAGPGGRHLRQPPPRGGPRHDGREGLPWWFFALAGGAASFWLLWPVVARWLGLDGEGESPLGDPGSLRAALDMGALRSPLYPRSRGRAPLGWLIIRPVNWCLAWVFRGFNWLFDAATRVYARVVGWNLRLSVGVLLLYVALLGADGLGFFILPGGFIPNQDKGYLIVNIQLPDSASLERTVAIMDRIQKIAAAEPGVAHTVDIPGQSFVMNGVSSNFGSLFIVLKPFHDRRSPELYSEAIAAKIRGRTERADPGRSCWCSGRRPWTDWATPAASG